VSFVCRHASTRARGIARDAACVDVDDHVRVVHVDDDARCPCRATDALGDEDEDDARVVPNGSREDATGDWRGTSGDRGARVDGERR